MHGEQCGMFASTSGGHGRCGEPGAAQGLPAALRGPGAFMGLPWCWGRWGWCGPSGKGQEGLSTSSKISKALGARDSSCDLFDLFCTRDGAVLMGTSSEA